MRVVLDRMCSYPGYFSMAIFLKSSKLGKKVVFKHIFLLNLALTDALFPCCR